MYTETRFDIDYAGGVLDGHLLGEALRMGVADGERMLAEYRCEYGQDMPEGEVAEFAPLDGEWVDGHTPKSLTALLFSDAAVDLEDAPEEWLAGVEQDIADEYERGYFEALMGEAVPCRRSWPRAICLRPGTYCDCDITMH